MEGRERDGVDVPYIVSGVINCLRQEVLLVLLTSSIVVVVAAVWFWPRDLSPLRSSASRT